jgi:hypothetical protein
LDYRVDLKLKKSLYMCSDIYPDVEWEQASRSEAGFDSAKLSDAGRCLAGKVGNGHYRVVIIRHGHLVAKWYHDFVITCRSSPASTINFRHLANFEYHH